MDARTGVVIAPPHLPGMHGFRLGERLRTDVGKPVAVRVVRGGADTTVNVTVGERP